MLGFFPLGTDPLGSSGAPTLFIFVDPEAAVTNVGVASAPFVVTIEGGEWGEESIFINSSLGSLITPQTLIGAGNFRVTPLHAGIDTLRITNGAGATNPAPIILTVNPPVVPPIVPLVRQIVLRLKTQAGVPRKNLTGIDWASFDQLLPSALLDPTDQGSNAVTNASGFLLLSVRTMLDIGDDVLMIVAIPGDGDTPDDTFVGRVTLQ